MWFVRWRCPRAVAHLDVAAEILVGSVTGAQQFCGILGGLRIQVSRSGTFAYNLGLSPVVIVFLLAGERPTSLFWLYPMLHGFDAAPHSDVIATVLVGVVGTEVQGVL